MDQANLSERTDPKSPLDIVYDDVNDVLYVSYGPPRPCVSEEARPGVFVNFDEHTNEPLGFTVVKITKQMTKTGANAVHVDLKDGNNVVGLGNVRVIVVPDGDGWFAQGLEIDYAAQGGTIEEAKQHFENGLLATIEQHLKINGNIKKLLTPSPAEEIQALIMSHGEKLSYTSISGHQLPQEMPFDSLSFLIPRPAVLCQA